VEIDCGLDGEDENPSPVTSSSALLGSDPDQQVVKEEETPESRQMAAARTKQRGEAAGGCGSVEEDGGGLDEEDLKPSLVTGSAALTPDPLPDQEVIQEEEEARGEIPSGQKVHFPFEASSPKKVSCRQIVP
jgi:hypothetical protein